MFLLCGEQFKLFWGAEALGFALKTSLKPSTTPLNKPVQALEKTQVSGSGLIGILELITLLIHDFVSPRALQVTSS